MIPVHAATAHDHWPPPPQRFRDNKNPYGITPGHRDFHYMLILPTNQASGSRPTRWLPLPSRVCRQQRTLCALTHISMAFAAATSASSCSSVPLTSPLMNSSTKRRALAILVLHGRRLHSRSSEPAPTGQVAVERNLGRTHGVDHNTGGIRGIPPQLVFEVQRHIAERGALKTHEGELAVVSQATRNRTGRYARCADPSRAAPRK